MVSAGALRGVVAGRDPYRALKPGLIDLSELLDAEGTFRQ